MYKKDLALIYNGWYALKPNQIKLTMMKRLEK